MSDHTLHTLATGGRYFEGPRWRDGRWWASDLYRGAVYTYTPDGTEQEILSLGGDKPSGLGFLPDGSLLVVGQEERKVWRRSPDGTVSLHADLNSDTKTDLNDLAVGSDGRAFVGTYGFDPFNGDKPALGSVIRVEADGSHAVAATDLLFPNGMVILPDGRLVVGECLGGTYTAFTIGSDGELTDRQVWARLSAPPSMESMPQLMETVEVMLDGCTADAEGAIWAADPKNARCIRIREGGEILDEIPAPDGLNIFACMLGDDDGRTLLLCVAPGLASNERGLDATLRTTTVAVPHAGHP